MSSTGLAGLDAALRHLPYGVYIVTTRGPQGDHGLTASWVMQVSKNPPMVAIALRRGSESAKTVAAGEVFAVNIISSEALELAERFFTPVDRFGSPPSPIITRGARELPLLGEAIGWIECQVREQMEVGDHVLFLGEVIGGDLKQDDIPLTTLVAGMHYGGARG
ncbi:MAG: flavin reductase [Armatimonadetes bacterium]|nr:flavin reductase [Armatimonadota bacterium]